LKLQTKSFCISWRKDLGRPKAEGLRNS